jgi:hypothetical protein
MKISIIFKKLQAKPPETLILQVFTILLRRYKAKGWKKLQLLSENWVKPPFG